MVCAEIDRMQVRKQQAGLVSTSMGCGEKLSAEETFELGLSGDKPSRKSSSVDFTLVLCSGGLSAVSALASLADF